MTPSSPARRIATCWACTARSSSRSGAGATTSWQMPSRWVEATTGHAATWPEGERATRAESSRRKSRAPRPGSSGPARRPARRRRRPPRRWRRTTRPCRRTRPASSSARTAARTPRPRRARPRPRCAGTGPSAPSFSRITALSWACTRASGPGRTGSVASSACRCSVGTCSWSKVTTAQPAVTSCRWGGPCSHRPGGPGHLRGADAGRLGQQAQGYAESGGRLGHHPGQLAATDHGDRRGQGVAGDSGASRTRPGAYRAGGGRVSGPACAGRPPAGGRRTRAPGGPGASGSRTVGWAAARRCGCR